MTSNINTPEFGPEFYEEFWKNEDFAFRYQLDSALRDRFPAIQEVWGNLPSPESVLDFGCGNGVLTDHMFRNGFGSKLLGVDISKKGINFAKKKFQGSNLQFQTYSPGQEDSLPQCDVLVSSHVLEHLHDPSDVLCRILPLAKLFVLEVPLESCLLQNTIDRFRPQRRKNNAVGHVNFWSKATFREFLENSGLTIIKDFHYAAAPFSPFTPPYKRTIEQTLLKLLGLRIYEKLMATHYIVLAKSRT